MPVEMKCKDVCAEISNFVEGEVDLKLRRQMESHFQVCKQCTSLLEGTRNLVRLAGDERAFAGPTGFGQRLNQRIKEHLDAEKRASSFVPSGSITLGITNDRVPIGSHVVYFWQNDAEFERGVRFIDAGLQSEDYCVVFGHEEATTKVFQVLREKGFDVDTLLRDGRLTLLRRDSLAFVTLSNISRIFQAAVRRGAPAIRFLGNLGMGKAPLPVEGQDDVLELEARVTSAARDFPCVVVCMYDVNTLPGRIVIKGGFETHPLAVCGESLHDNPFYVPEENFLSHLHHTH